MRARDANRKWEKRKGRQRERERESHTEVMKANREAGEERDKGGEDEHPEDENDRLICAVGGSNPRRSRPI